MDRKDSIKTKWRQVIRRKTCSPLLELFAFFQRNFNHFNLFSEYNRLSLNQKCESQISLRSYEECVLL